MRLLETNLPGVVIVEPQVYGDDRGYFLETWNQERYAEAGLNLHCVQDNVSFSRRGTLRGLHFQNPRPQGKLICVLEGEVYDVAVDVRYGSPTFGQWVGLTLSGKNKQQVYVPPGFAHGYCVVSETALVAYKCTELYHPEGERCILWNDPDLAIPWPVKEPILSAKDGRAGRLREQPRERLTFDPPGSTT